MLLRIRFTEVKEHVCRFQLLYKHRQTSPGSLEDSHLFLTVLEAEQSEVELLD